MALVWQRVSSVYVRARACVGHRTPNHVGILYMPQIVIRLQMDSVLLSNAFGETKEIESYRLYFHCVNFVFHLLPFIILTLFFHSTDTLAAE